jgi:N-acetyl-gamma-glutamyl-phosphate reductase
MQKVRIGIIGGAGYTGGELIRLLLRHPHADIRFVHSTSNAGKPVAHVHRDLLGDTDMHFEGVFTDEHIDVLFLCSGHGQSAKFFSEHPVKDDLRIIDLSQDFRIYSAAHFRPFVYGLCEADTEALRHAQNVANPGCFATAIQLALLPLARANALNSDIHVTAITGSTGAGQSLSATSHFSWRNNNVSVYKAFNHQHLLEIRQSLEKWQDEFSNDINFIPYRGNFTRGILASVYVKTDMSAATAGELFEETYASSPFVHVSDANIDLKQVVNTNKGLLHIETHGDYLLVISAIDNLLKGASGQAVQNMNLMTGLPESAGLDLKPIAF